ncbi:hypothetical protein EV356DRAFT_34976 [Viridothelium virens]|uniref:Uncharacterized protein n=1 Tax=Viridothelium virens TaxID=1048519 RepID=A0A6A6GUB4_VIRVR|nr:hypothetical protein EV356DRAFT_34976 [Viridothelium virens]
MSCRASACDCYPNYREVVGSSPIWPDGPFFYFPLLIVEVISGIKIGSVNEAIRDKRNIGSKSRSSVFLFYNYSSGVRSILFCSILVSAAILVSLRRS